MIYDLYFQKRFDSRLYQFTLYITTQFTIRHFLQVFIQKDARDSKKSNISYTNHMILLKLSLP